MKAAPRLLALVLLGLATVPSVWAGHRHYRPHVGIIVGPYISPWWSYQYPPYYYGSYPPYYPPVIVQRVAPPVYIEQQAQSPLYVEQQQTQQPATGTVPPPINYWYYCPPKQAYYPYVKECSTGWQKVLPTPPGQQGSAEDAQK